MIHLIKQTRDHLTKTCQLSEVLYWLLFSWYTLIKIERMELNVLFTHVAMNKGQVKVENMFGER